MRKLMLITAALFAFLTISSLTWASKGSIETVLQSIIDGKRPAQDITISYTVGNPHFRGRTNLIINGNGSTKLTFTKQNKTDTYQGTIEPQSITNLLKTMLEDKYWTAIYPTGKRLPDSVDFNIHIYTKQKDLDNTFKYPVNKALYEKKTQTVFRIFQSLIKIVSKGKVHY